jgi:hypothetical protein
VSVDTSDMIEWCDECGRETPHAVRIKIRTESTKEENAKFSREPYRVSVCQTCQRQREARVNDFSTA